MNLLEATKPSAFQSEGRRGSPEQATLVCFHGIMGSPRQFHPWIEQLPASVPYYNFLLPGHGASQKDFSRSSVKLWQAFVDEKLDSLHRQERQIVVLTHSMGGLLTVDYYKRSQNRPKRLLFLALPLRIHFRMSTLRQSLSVLQKSEASDPATQAAQEAYSIQPGPWYGYLAWLPHHLALLQKIHSVRQHIKGGGRPFDDEDGRANSLAFFGSCDELVSLSSRKILEKAGIRCLLLPNSSHNYYPPESRQLILDHLLTALGCP